MMCAVQALPGPAIDAARQWWDERFPLPRRGTPEGDAPAWSFANTCAGFDDAAMARCLVAMGLRRVAVVSRGQVAWWPPDYHRAGLHADRPALARVNRFIRDSRVFVMRAGAPGGVIPAPDLLLLVDVDAGDGAWRTCSGGAVGEDWIGLGAFCWRLSRGQAAARIARVCGYRRLPRVGDLR
jgi:hypothetical protein